MRLGVFVVEIINPAHVKHMQLYALQDTGADSTVLCRTVAKKLGLRGERIRVMVGGINTVRSVYACSAPLRIKGIGKQESHALHDVLLLERLPTVASSLPHNLDIEKYPHLHHLELHHIPREACDMLIRSDNFHLFEHRIESANSILFCVETDLGWTIMGSEQCKDTHENEQLVNTVYIPDDI